VPFLDDERDGHAHDEEVEPVEHDAHGRQQPDAPVHLREPGLVDQRVDASTHEPDGIGASRGCL
jgi:hypothetical protein